MGKHFGKLFATALLVVSAGFARGEDVSLTVRCDRPGHEISPRLVGIFFEDINFGADGGLSAELVKNGSFEVPGDILGWSARPTRNADGRHTKQSEAPLSVSNSTFLRLESDDEDGWYAVVNDGFRGMGVRAGQEYLFSAHFRSTACREETARVRVRVRILAEDGDVLAEESVRVVGSAWRLHERTLVPSETDAGARLEISMRAPGVVDMDLVSLCPRDTWRGRPHGLRKDVVQLLADLKPAFFRFPGGCIVEGSQLKYRYQWKSTIGPPEERRMIVNRWNTEFRHRLTPDYYQSFALGFFEYFQLAEDLGAEPMPILNCGMACQFNSGELVPLDELGPYIQDALDLIEFANGPLTSEWGAKRAAMGHPEPFGMKMLGVGNEQWGQDYFDRYVKFAEVLKAVHPEIELISTSGPFPSGERFDFAWPLLRRLKVDVVDEHCYAMPDWFLREATRFDTYDRNGPKVFMGEYAAQSVDITSPDNRNNLRCALAEAAFLTGIERNSDVVTMSAYAPLMAHEDAWQWRPNLIWCDNLNSYGTPNYYVQQLFSHHRGDVVLPVELDDPRPAPPPAGRIGLATNETAVEFSDVKVTDGDTTLFDGASLDSTDEMTIFRGRWELADGEIRQTSPRESGRVTFGDYAWRDYTLSLKARKTRGREGFVVIFRHGRGGSYLEWNIGGWKNERHGLIAHLASHSDTPTMLAEVDGSIDEDRWYDVRVEVEGSHVRCSLDNELIHDVNIPYRPIAQLFVAASFDRDASETILKVVNPTDGATETGLDFQGVEQVGPTCQLIELSGQPDDENSLAEPSRVVPRTRQRGTAGPRFVHSFPPHSLTVMRLPTDVSSGPSVAQAALSGELGVHDPSSIVVDDGKYYLFYTGGGVASKVSTDLSEWRNGRSIFPRRSPPEWTDSVPRFRGRMWAPDVIKIGDTFHVYYSVSSFGRQDSAIGLATSRTLYPESPDYEWTDHGPVIQSEEGDPYNTIDPSVLMTSKGELWMVFGSYWDGIFLFQLDPKTGLRLDSEVAPIRLADNEQIEAATLVEHDGKFYLFVNHGRCCRGVRSTYHVLVGRSDNVTGPYLDRDGRDLVDGGGTLVLETDGPRIGPGHVAPLAVADDNRFGYHYYDGNDRGRSKLALGEWVWSDDGWPSARKVVDATSTETE